MGNACQRMHPASFLASKSESDGFGNVLYALPGAIRIDAIVAHPAPGVQRLEQIKWEERRGTDDENG